MPSKHTELNKALICSHLCKVTDHETAWVLLQSPGFIGFGVVQSGDIRWPPSVQPDWTRVSDLRLFGEKGEWHVWSHWDESWQSRFLKLEDIPEPDALTEYHVLWGTEIQSPTSPWVTLVEERGTEIWLPLAELKEDDLPLRLKIKQVIDYDQKYGLAGITDAALVALVSRPSYKEETVQFPPSSL